MINNLDLRRARPPLWQGVLVSLTGLGLYAYTRLYLNATSVVSLSYAVPLLFTLWHRRLPLHYMMAAALSILAGFRLFVQSPPTPGEPSAWTSFAMMMVNIWVVVAVIDWLVRAEDALFFTNDELGRTNVELASREEEISSQNEELQRQTEEMERQMEELQQQSADLQHQSTELQEWQSEAQSRERILGSLFQISTSVGGDGEVGRGFGRICGATIEAFGKSVSAAMLLERTAGELVVRGHCGLATADALREGARFDGPFPAMVVAEGRTACIEDLAKTPDVRTPEAADGGAFRAILAAPLLNKGAVVGVIVIYSKTPHAWSDSDFKTAEWLAAQGALLLEAINLRDELDRRGRDAQAASRRKTQFLAAVSHDVRTPANAINLIAELLELAGDDPQLAAELPQMLRGLRSNSQQLVELVSDMLDISRLDSDKVDLDTIDFDLTRAVKAEVDQHESLAHRGGIDLRMEAPTGPLWVRTDRMKLIRVLANLVGNSIKFTERGSVVVALARTERGLDLAVADTGVGIPHDHLDHIFDEFFQVKNPERDRSKGTGLGLAICRRLIDALGFSISVRSRPGDGSTFTVHIPEEALLAEPPTGEGQPIAEGSPDGRINGLRVLLVEDHEATRAAASRLLKQYGAHVEQAKDGREALQSLRQGQTDVLLLDLMLPDMDGREVLRRIQEQRPSGLKCVLAVSGDVRDERTAEVSALGADGMVAKPINVASLVERIAEALERTPDSLGA